MPLNVTFGTGLCGKLWKLTEAYYTSPLHQPAANKHLFWESDHYLLSYWFFYVVCVCVKHVTCIVVERD
jgi:hypothetical protein